MAMSSWRASSVCAAVLMALFASAASAQNQSAESPTSTPAPAALPPSSIPPLQQPAIPSPPIPPPVVPSANPPAEQDPMLTKTIGLHRRQQVAQHLAIGKRLFDRRLYAQAAHELAVAYVFEAWPAILLEIASACRRAELDQEALEIYERLQNEQSQPSQHEQIEEELKALHAKLEDTELGMAQALREHMDLGKKCFQSGQFAQAAQQYALSYALKPLPRLLFNTAQAYRRAGRPDEASVLYVRFLDEDPATPLKKETQGYLEELRVVAFRPPIYKRAWFWGALGAAAVLAVAGAAGLGVALTPPKDPATNGGTHILSFGLGR